MVAKVISIHQESSYYILKEAGNDKEAIDMWLHNKSERTKVEYRREVNLFLRYIKKFIYEVSLKDIQLYLDSIEGKSINTQFRIINTIKSLFSFCSKVGYIGYNPAALVVARAPRVTLSERILTEEEVCKVISMAKGRDWILLKFLYVTGLRASELTGVSWGDFSELNSGDYVLSVYGKGRVTRHVIIPLDVFVDIKALKKETSTNFSPVFVSRFGKRLCQSQVWRLIKKYTALAGIDKSVSAVWFRHSCVSHSLDHGCPPHVVQQQMGHSSLATTSIYAHVRPNEGASLYLNVK